MNRILIGYIQETICALELIRKVDPEGFKGSPEEEFMKSLERSFNEYIAKRQAT